MADVYCFKIHERYNILKGPYHLNNFFDTWKISPSWTLYTILTPFTFKLADKVKNIRVKGYEKLLVSLRNRSEKWLVSLRKGSEKWLVSLLFLSDMFLLGVFECVWYSVFDNEHYKPWVSVWHQNVNL